MKQNSFQKNGFLNVGGGTTKQCVGNNFDINIQNIRDRMWNAKASNFSSQKDSNVNNLNNINKPVDHQQRVADLKNLNRWKG